jgi:ATP-dependent phosphofructokinase / diphosphate-dependent phosphofructokinase
MPKNILYAQSGGVTSVINASACGVIEAARAARGRVGKVYAGRDGIIGVLTEDLIDTSRESAANIRALLHTPGGAFGSARYKLPPIEKDRRPYERLIEVFRAHDIGWFLYNGGNDSMDTCAKISRIGAELGYPVAAIGIPKTIDNDLVETDTCPGFGSVAKYVATSMREASFDVHSMARTSTRVFVMEVMGRHAGWITAACGLAAETADDGPQVLLFPERVFDEATFLAKVKATVARVGWCTIGVSEGVKRADGRFLSESGLTDAFGHAQLGGVAPMIADLVRRELKLKNHWAVCDYLQRAARHIASKTDLDQSYRMGAAAVKAAIAGQSGIMMTIERLSAKPYRWRVGSVPLAKVANRERTMPRGFISRDGFSITAACREYLTPLVRGEAPPPYRDGLPRFVKLANRAVGKKLPGGFEI